MFSRKKPGLIKTHSISKKCRAGSPVLQASLELPRRDGQEMSSSSLLDLSSSAPASALKRPTSLSRHSSAAGFPLSPVIPRGLAKGHKPHIACSPCEATEGSLIEPEDISQLLADVACFADRLENLKDAVLREDQLDSRRPLAHECLGEALRILRQVINRYPLLNTLETLTAAGTLISKVKGFHYEANNEMDKREFEKALEMIAVSFSSTVSEFLMGEVDSSTLLSIPPSDQNQSMENLYGGITGQSTEETLADMKGISSVGLSAEEVDVLLQKCEGGMEVSLQYAKNISKYMKDLIYYLEKRTILEIEFAKGLQKVVNACKQNISQESHMPLRSIYSLTLEQDMEYSINALQAATTLQKETFLQELEIFTCQTELEIEDADDADYRSQVQQEVKRTGGHCPMWLNEPLTARRLEHEKRRKEIKEQWHRAQRKVQEAESNLRKAKQLYMQRSVDLEKAKSVMIKAEEEQQAGSGATTTKTLDKKRKLEEEARNKAEEAMATYRTCIADANTQRQELEDTKVTSLRQIHEVIKQSDQVIKSATISFYQIMHMQTAPLPVYFQTLCESSKLYDPGHQYASHVKGLQRGDEPEMQYDFEPYVPHNWSPMTRIRKGSFNASEFATATSSDTAGKEGATSEGDRTGVLQSGSANLERRGGRHQVHKSWPTAITETKGSLESCATNSGEFSQKFQQMSSNGALSPGDDSDGNSPSFEQSINGITPEISTTTGPFRNVGLSKAAQTHRLRKLRAPSKCRECNSYVYFQGAECEECYLACHKKCLETLAIQCGHKKLQGKLRLFGQEFKVASQASSDGIPFIIKKCICEIEKRALKTKGIYRVNGVKTRVEKLCQAFENGKELVELSQASPHDISNVLKLYLRQLPEPIMPFHMYNALMGLAKESLQGRSEGKSGKDIAELVDKGAETDKVVVTLVTKLKTELERLPWENLATLKYIMQHLRRIVEVEQDNKMSSGNLGIVFGPTLMRPRPTEATISLSSLVDYPHQARIVEALIVFYPVILEAEDTLKEDNRAMGNEEDTDAQSPSDSLYFTVEQTETTDPEDACRESGDPSIDSDSDPEDSPELEPEETPEITLMTQGSESSGDEEIPFVDDVGQEGDQSQLSSISPLDEDKTLVPVRSPIKEEEQHGLEGDVIYRGDAEDEEQQERPLAGHNINQSNNKPFSHLLLG